MRYTRYLPGILLSGLIAGCSSLGGTADSLRTLPQEIAPRTELVETPFFPQERHHCGPAALATVLQHRHIDTTPERLSRLTYLPGLQGSLQIELTATARQQGVVVYPLEGGLNELLREVAAGNPVLILQNQAFNWYPRWHYAVVIGYDLEQELLVMRSGRERRWISGFSTFMKTWKRAGNWAILTLPPDLMPATAEAATYLKAVNDLEQTGQIDVANLAYRNAVAHWPRNFTARFALGNSAYGKGDWAGAVESFLKATELEPGSSSAWNNLAYALLADGRGESALEAIRQARLLSPDDPNLRDSEQEIRQRLENP